VKRVSLGEEGGFRLRAMNYRTPVLFVPDCKSWVFSGGTSRPSSIRRRSTPTLHLCFMLPLFPISLRSMPLCRSPRDAFLTSPAPDPLRRVQFPQFFPRRRHTSLPHRTEDKVSGQLKELEFRSMMNHRCDLLPVLITTCTEGIPHLEVYPIPSELFPLPRLIS